MSMRALAAVVAKERPACSDRLDLVDAAFHRVRSPAAHQLAEEVCPRCPLAVAQACFMAGITGVRGQEVPAEGAKGAGEWGVWGGTLETQRRQARRRR